MIGLAFDENFNNDVLRGLLRRRPELDVLRHRTQACAPAMTRLCWHGLQSRAGRW
jgi:hypothetical protein